MFTIIEPFYLPTDNCTFTIEGISDEDLERKVKEILNKLGINVTAEKIYRMPANTDRHNRAHPVVVELSSTEDKGRVQKAAAAMAVSSGDSKNTDQCNASRRVDRKQQQLADLHAAIKTGNWVMEKRFGEDGPGNLRGGCDISVCPNSDIAIIDRNADKIMIYTNAGDYLRHIDISGTVGMFAGIVVSGDGWYYITNKYYVKGFSTEGEYQHKFPAISPDYTPSDIEETSLLGIVIDGDGHLLVGAQSGYISKHELDGKHISSIKLRRTQIPYFLCVCPNSNIVVSLIGSVQVIDPTGHVLCNLTAPPGVYEWTTRGVCCHEDIIFIASDAANGIHCFSVTGQYMGCVTNDVKNPWRLDVTADGKRLVVLDDDFSRATIFKARE